MAEDPKISRRYRDLPREEPPRHVDEAILAAARRAIAGEKKQARPAPLVVPSGRRWYFPLAAAAVIVLAVAVTVHVERERPDPELAIPPVTAPKAPAEQEALRSERAAELAKPAAKPEVFAPDPKPEQAPRSRESPAPEAPPPESRALQAQRDATQLQQDAVSGVRESARADAAAERAPRAARQRSQAMAGGLSSFARASPEQWLQGIADLRRQGRHEEADKALAEFRRAYPDYRMSEAMLEKVERKREK